MNVQIDDELIIAGVARAAGDILSSDKFIDRVVDAILLRFEALTPFEAAKFLDVTTRTLQEKHVEWGLDKSLMLGPTNPRYLLSQVIGRMRTKVVRGSQKSEVGSQRRPAFADGHPPSSNYGAAGGAARPVVPTGEDPPSHKATARQEVAAL